MNASRVMMELIWCA